MRDFYRPDAVPVGQYASACLYAVLPWIIDTHGYIRGYIHVWISDLGHNVDISMDMYISFNSN